MASEIGFIVFYVSFFSAIFILGTFDIQVGTDEIATPPLLSDLDDNLDLISFLLFVFDVVAYFFLLQGLTIVGLPASVALGIALIFDVTLIYVIARLVRGGG